VINRIIEQIGRRARVEHNGDWSKAATEFFRDHPEEWQSYAEEVTEVNKRAGEDPNYVNALVQSRTEITSVRTLVEQIQLIRGNRINFLGNNFTK
jgi:hypothetical protein